ncbi:hypothetical protein, partial [Streptomyces sp. NPDC005799]|uniref:hypothetical protein n=1 Tax=Streptomyces sp. NPDC005799 TaxID=3154678 RepID=UPI0033F67A0B
MMPAVGRETTQQCPECGKLKIYAKCIDGQEQEMNDRIMQGLGERDDLSGCCRSDLEACRSNGSPDQVIVECSAHTSRAS